jgi:transcriptional regulator with XRE-family HTH domain
MNSENQIPPAGEEKTEKPLNEKIRDLRKSRGYTIKELCNKTGLGSASITNFESASPPDISRSSIIALSKALDISSDYFFTDHSIEYYAKQKEERFYTKIFDAIDTSKRQTAILMVELLADECKKKQWEKEKNKP